MAGDRFRQAVDLFLTFFHNFTKVSHEVLHTVDVNVQSIWPELVLYAQIWGNALIQVKKLDPNVILRQNGVKWNYEL